MELVIEGNVFFEGRPQRLAIGIENGLIASVRKVLRGARTIDFGGRLILPGAIDAHVHFRDPGLTQKEDFLSGTTSAACGGVTTVVDMPNTRPPVLSLADLDDKLSTVRRRAGVDFGLYVGLSGRGRPERAAPFATGYKLYMGSTTGDLLVDDYSTLPALMAPLSGAGRPVAVHAEDEPMLRSKKAVPRDPLAYNEARPPECETQAVSKFLGALGANRGHVCHVSSRGALELLRPSDGPSPPQEGRTDAAAGQKDKAADGKRTVTSEVTPHHLLLDARGDNGLGTLGKMNPPLRRHDQREALWNAFLDGRIDCLASDHAPHLEEEKDTGFPEAPAGVPGTETMVPLMMMFVKDGRVPIERLADAACAAPARIFGLPGGRIAPGMPAHLAVYDLHEPRAIRGKKLNSKCAWSPFEGREAIFPKAVFLRGRLIVDGWEPSVAAGEGVFQPGKPQTGPV